MYTNVWNKYLPVIRILLKKSKAGEQTLNLNLPDFERAGIGRKSGHKFNILFSKGKVKDIIIASPIASNLAALLLEDDTIKELMRQDDYQIIMNPKFQLTIRQVAPVTVEEEAIIQKSGI